jgi:hypothetical protein
MADVYDKVGGFIADKVKSSFKDTLKGAGKSLSGAAKSITGGSKTQQIGSDNKPVPEKSGNKLGGVDSTLMNINQSLQSILSSSSVLPTISKEIGLISKNVDKIPKIIKKSRAEDFFYKQKQKENFEELFRRVFKVEQKSGMKTGRSTSKGLGLSGAAGGIGQTLATVLGVEVAKAIAGRIKDAIKNIFKRGGELFKKLGKFLKKSIIGDGGKRVLSSVAKRIIAGGALVAVAGPYALAVFAVAAVLKGIYDGIMGANEGEVFSFKEAFGGLVEFLSAGLVSDDFAKGLFDSIGNVFDKIKSFLGSMFSGKSPDKPKEEPKKESSGRPKDSKLGSTENTGVDQPTYNMDSKRAPAEEQSSVVSPAPVAKADVTPNSYQQPSAAPAGFDPSNMIKTSSAPSQAPSQGDSMRAGLGNFMNNTGASDMLGNNIMPMMGKMKSGGGNVNKGDMMKKGFSSMFGGMGQNMGVDAGAVMGDLKGGVQGIKSAKGEDKQTALFGALGNLANNPAIKNFKGKESTEESRAENRKNVSGGLDSLIGGMMGGVGVDTKALQEQYGNEPMSPGSGGSSPSIYDSGTKKAPSGSAMSESSNYVSEGQRMESAPKGGGIQVESQTNNNSSKGKTGGSKKAPPVINQDLFKQINIPGGFAI